MRQSVTFEAIGKEDDFATGSDTGPDHPETPITVTSGFVPAHPLFHKAYNIFLGSVLLLIALPSIVLISVALLLTQGWHVFYRGTRVGKGGVHYNIIKFRTLNGSKAKEITKSSVLPADSGIETPLGGFLRDTRLDELPQLLNVALGQMNICGPRPVRPEIVEIQRRSIPNYDIRFEVVPGLIGPTQAYMHHGTSKAIRARYNNILCRAPVRYLGELTIVGLVGYCVLARTAAKLWDRMGDVVFGSGVETRAAARAENIELVVRHDDGEDRRALEAIDRGTLSLADRGPFPERVGLSSPAELKITLPNGHSRSAAVSLVPTSEGRFAYRARTDYAHHVVSRYLWQAVVVPHTSQVWGAVPMRRVARLKRAVYRRIAGLRFFARSVSEEDVGWHQSRGQP